MCHMHAKYPERSEEKRPSDFLVLECEPQCGFWEMNPGPPQEKVVLTTESSLYAESSFLK